MKKQKILIMLFMAGIALPNLLFAVFKEHLDTANHENRALAEQPRLSVETLEEFPKQFENFYNDHLPFKNYLVRLNYQLDTKIFLTTRKGDVTIGKDNWLFYTPSRSGEDAMADYRKTNLYSEEESREIAGRYERAEGFLKEKGVENFYCYVAPSKETVYPQYMPYEPGEGQSRMECFADYMESHSDLNFHYVYPKLAEDSQEYQIYFKYDTHMNSLGAFLMSQIMADDLTGERVSLKDVKVKQGDVFVGDLARMVNQESSMTDDHDLAIKNYYPRIQCDIITNNEENSEEIFREYTSDSTNDRTLLVVGDSYRLKLEPYLSKLYSHSVFVRIDDFSQELLEKYDPQDVVMVMVERNQRYMENPDQYLGLP